MENGQKFFFQGLCVAWFDIQENVRSLMGLSNWLVTKQAGKMDIFLEDILSIQNVWFSNQPW